MVTSRNTIKLNLICWPILHVYETECIRPNLLLWFHARLCVHPRAISGQPDSYTQLGTGRHQAVSSYLVSFSTMLPFTGISANTTIAWLGQLHMVANRWVLNRQVVSICTNSLRALPTTCLYVRLPFSADFISIFQRPPSRHRTS